MDYIHRPGVKTEKRLGGILYSVVSLAVISGNENDVYPIMNLGEDEFENVTGFLSSFKNIHTDYIIRTPHETRVVNLYYKDKTVQFKCPETGALKTYDREENSTKPTFPVEFSLVEKALPQMDALLINLVSGIDLTLDTLQNIRKSFNGYIHMDLHNLVMNTHEDGTRTQGPVAGWLEWCRQSTTLQMNESEISVLPREKLHEYETAEKILSDPAIEALVITRGKLGVTLYESKQKQSGDEKYYEPDRFDLPAVEQPHFIDSTGCGDVFAAGFMFNNCMNDTKNFNASLNRANKIASKNAALFGVEELSKLG
jgi:hypothetical protein